MHDSATATYTALGIAPALSAGGELEARLGWLRRLLLWQVEVTQHTFGRLADDDYRGLYVPRAEVDILAAGELELPPGLAEERRALATERDAIEAEAGEGPLGRLARLFGLDAFEQDALLLALAPELDLRFERIIAYIQDDVSRRRPAVDLALRLFCRTPAERIARQSAFEADAPLLRRQLVQLVEDGQRRAPLPARYLKLDDRIAAELRCAFAGGEPPIDPAIRAFAELVAAPRGGRRLVLPAGLLERLGRTLDAGAALGLQGGYGSGRRAVAEALCAERGMPLLLVDVARLATAEPALGPEEAIGRATREAELRGAMLLWCGADALLHDEEREAWRRALLREIAARRGPDALAIERAWEARGQIGGRGFVRVQLPELGFGERERVWRGYLGSATPDDTTLEALASTFRLSAGQIRDAAGMARVEVGLSGAGLGRAALFAASRAQSSGRLSALAHKVPGSYSWDDIVLPADQLAQLREICIQVRHRRTVLEGWGFDRRLAMGKGVNALFAGPSGTGKTMAAEIIAGELGLDLYKIDLSALVNKYIGETEKNLDRVFQAAREANAVLFFDEADAIFGKRSEVRDAHDRYANIEVGYLLQKMEEYDGVVVLATNLRKNLDEAFVRRLHVAVDFPFPEEADRLSIWQKVFPAEAPLDADVDLRFLARQFRLAGGNIRNAALLAAYLAAEAGGAIRLDHIVQAVRREYQKMGKLTSGAGFERIA